MFRDDLHDRDGNAIGRQRDLDGNAIGTSGWSRGPALGFAGVIPEHVQPLDHVPPRPADVVGPEADDLPPEPMKFSVTQAVTASCFWTAVIARTIDLDA